MFNWFNARPHQAFGEQLANFYVERVVRKNSNLHDKKTAAKQLELLNKLANQVDAFKKSNRMNFYQKAQLSNTFKWKLLDAGFEPAYVEELTSWLVKKL